MRIKDLLNLLKKYSEDCVCDSYDCAKGKKCSADFLKEEMAEQSPTPEITRDPELDLVIEAIRDLREDDRHLLFDNLEEFICLGCKRDQTNCFCSYDVDDRD